MDTFVGREEDIRNITGYLDFTSSDVQVVHIVGPPGFGKSTLAKQIGHILLRKRVKVQYADLRGITNLDTVAEKVMLSIVDSTKHKVTFDRLEQWVHKQYSNNLLILDNCDEMFETHKKTFLDAIRTLTLTSSKKSVRYILTSQKWEADVGNFQLHAIYNMSSEAASQLLSKLAPSLTDVQKMQIAELTGNVPLALDVVGAIFKFPNAPTAEEVIQGLKQNPVTTLSPPELHSHLDTCIGLAFDFLSPDLKELCINLSQFPGSFDQRSASRIVYAGIDIELQLKTLVRRSLLFNQHTRFHFHQLIREYFLQKSGAGKRCGDLMQNFKSEFLQYFAEYLKSMLEMTTYKALDADKHNLQCMFAMFGTAEQNNVTLYAVTITLTAIQSKFLQARFSDREIYDILQNMLKAMESYSANEEASHEAFFEIYHKIVFETLNVGKLLHIETHSLIEILMSRKNKVDGAYKRGLLGVNTYIQFFTDLAQLYEENGDDVKSRWCHVHILSRVHNKLHGCYPVCDYFSVSVAYESVGESVETFHFRELAFEHQATSLDYMSLIQLHLALYNDYMNSSLGNNDTKADEFSSLIISVDYVYLISADKYEYRKKVYYDTLDFFRTKHMEDYMVQIQNKMLAVERECSSDDCVDYYMSSSLHAWKRQSYYLTIELGKLGFEHSKMSIESCETHSDALHTGIIVGASYYYIGNYSDAQIWLKCALQIVNENLKDEYSLKLRDERLGTCFYLLRSGDYFNLLCYGYFIKDFTIMLSYLTVEHLYTQYIFYTQQPPKQQPAADTVVLSTETGVTEEKYSFVWSQFNKHVHKFQSAIEKYVSTAEKTVSQLQMYKYFVYCIYICFLGCCVFLIPFLILCAFYLCIINCIRCLMSVCCTKQQIANCCTLYKFMAIACIVTTFVFVLGLDWLY